MRFAVDARRGFLQILALMGKDRDNDDERRESELAIAICGLTCALQEAVAQRHAELATKQDVQDATCAILHAIKGQESEQDERLLGLSLAKAGRISKRLKAVARAMAALDASTP